MLTHNMVRNKRLWPLFCLGVIILIIFKIFSALFVMVWILLQPFYWIIAKIFKFNTLKKDLCVVLNNLYHTDSFNPKDYIIIFYLFNGFIIRHKKTKDILASGSYAWSGYVTITTALLSPDTAPNIYPLNFDDSEITERINLFYRKGKITHVDQTITIRFVVNKNTRTSMFVYKDINISKNRDLEPTFLSLKTYELEDMYGNQIDYQEFQVSCYTIHDLYLSYLIDRMKADPNTISLLPELVEDSVCDYKSSQFTDRVILLEMLKF